MKAASGLPVAVGSPLLSLFLAGLMAVGLVGVLPVGCGGDGPTDPGTPSPPLPASFQVLGSAASSEPDGTTISCGLDLVFRIDPVPREEPGVLEYDGTHGGSLFRTILDAQGNGISLQPDVAGQAVVRVIQPDRVELLLPANAGTGSRFWEALAKLGGEIAPDGTVRGEWTCAPFDIDEGGYVDTKHTARGTWRLVPVA